MAVTRSRWPTSCCALARSKRYTRVNSGSPRIPSTGRMAASDRATSSASDCASAPGSRVPPMNVRSRTCAFRRPMRPLRRQPGRGEDAAVLGARHDVAGAVQRVCDRIPRKRERHGGNRRVGDFSAEAGDLGVLVAHQRRRDVRRSRQDEGAAFVGDACGHGSTRLDAKAAAPGALRDSRHRHVRADGLRRQRVDERLEPSRSNRRAAT